MRYLLLCLAGTLLPTGAAVAQEGLWGGVYVSHPRGFEIQPPVLFGFEVRSRYEIVALRMSGGMLPTRSIEDNGADESSIHLALDADLQLDLAEPGAVSVMPFVGIGLLWEAHSDTTAGGAATMWSYGGALRLPFDDAFGIQLEGRGRARVDRAKPGDRGIRDGWEARLTLIWEFPSPRRPRPPFP